MTRLLMRAAYVILTATLLAAQPLAAQPSSPSGARASSTKGFFIGAHLNGSSLTGDRASESETGGGGGLQLGYGFTPQLALVLDGTGAQVGSAREEFGLGHVDVMVRYAFTGPRRRFAPFLEVGYTGYGARMGDTEMAFDDIIMRGDVTSSGTGATLGGGVQWFASPEVALGLGLRWTTGDLDRVVFEERDGNEFRLDHLATDATTTRVNLGVAWYPMGGR